MTGAPIIPGMTASRANLEAVIRASADHGARFLSARVLHLHPGVKEHFSAFLAAEAPALLDLYARLYPGTYPSKPARIWPEPPPTTEGSPGRARASRPPGPEQLDLLPVED